VIIAFEKQELYEKNGSTIQKIVDESGLTWIRVPYTKNPPIFSTIYDVRKGLNLAKKLHRQHRFQIVHCRGYIPAIIGRQLKLKYGIKFIFDMRGWWADEKKESGFWNKKIYQPVYKYFKTLEKKFFRDADYSVSLTYKGKEEIERQKLATAQKVGVIPTCVDFEIFKPWNEEVRNEMRKELGIKDQEKVFVYSGSIGGNYDPQTLADVFLSFQKLYPNAFLLILSKDRFDEALQNNFAKQGIHRMAIRNVPFTQVTNYLRAGDVGFIYYKMSFSTIGRSPTKLGEYWASGIPVIAFRGIGDLDHILKTYPYSGVLLSEDREAWSTEIMDLKFTDRAQLRTYSEDYFHISKGVRFYEGIYSTLAPTKEVYEPVSNAAGNF
jgi:glycosyltransferase involved in cell wall biosynthesis